MNNQKKKGGGKKKESTVITSVPLTPGCGGTASVTPPVAASTSNTAGAEPDDVITTKLAELRAFLEATRFDLMHLHVQALHAQR